MRAAPIDKVLERLSKVRQRQPGQWSACCPAHADRGPSLSVRENLDGAVLLHCFAGCSPHAVAAGLGLDIADLFPPHDKPAGNAPKRTPRLLNAVQALELLDREANLVAVAAANVLQGVALSQNDLARIVQAAGRISWLRYQSIGGAHAR